MTSITKHIQHLSRAFGRLIRRLRRREMTVETRLTVSFPPFLKVEVGMKSEPAKPANDNRLRRRTRSE